VSEFLSLVLSGAVTGGLFAILAAGLVLTYQVSGVFNFSHGAIAFTAALLFYELNTGLGWNVEIAAIITVFVYCPLLGLLLDVAMFRRLAKAGSTAQIVTTIGLTIALPAAGLFIIQELLKHHVGKIADPTNVTSPPGLAHVPAHVYHLTDKVTLDANQIAVFIAAALSALLLWLVVSHTSLGLRMRACVDGRDLASLRGVDPGLASSSSWVLSVMLAGLTGVLGGPFLGLGSGSYTQTVLVAAAAAVFARFTSIPIAFAAGLSLGVAQNLIAGYVTPHLSFQGLSSSAPYILMFVGLLLLNVTRKRAAGTVSTERYGRGDRSLTLRQTLVVWLVVSAGVFIYVSFIASSIWIGVITEGLCTGLVFLSFTVVTGLGGMVSLSQATFVTAAGLASGYVIGHGHSFTTALVVGTLVAAAVGALVALPALRLDGLPLALSTLAIAYIGDLLVFQLNSVRNQALGWTVPRPGWFGIDFGQITTHGPRNFALLCLVLVLIGVLLVHLLERSSWGRDILAMRSSSVAAQASGLSTPLTKLIIFTCSAAIAGFGGVMLGSYAGGVTNLDHPTQVGLLWLAVVVTFGIRRPGYAVAAGLGFWIFQQVMNDYITTSAYIPSILFGLGGLTLAASPDGFVADLGERARELLSSRQVVPATAGGPAVTLPAAGTLTAPTAGAPSAAPAGATESGQPAFESAAAGLLSLRDVSAGYDGLDVLHHIDLDVAAGSIIALLGPNGAGKSTLCKVIAGLVLPSDGDVTFEGATVNRWSPHRRARAGLVLAPESRGIFPGLSIDENMRLLLDSAQRDEVYDRFPLLANRRGLAAGQLSGGEQQMLTLAPLLTRPPKVLVADEPSLGLAPKVVEQLTHLFRELADAGCAVVLVEEKLHGVASIAERVIAMDLGRLVWDRPAADVDASLLAETYLGIDRATAQRVAVTREA
jgi:ABC-type branched-subunit amino acid transport system ATPase component/branched-subunit amino acid ABC-type transport system permease component